MQRGKHPRSPTASPKAARPKLQWERLSDIREEVKTLLPVHWREVDVFHDDAPLDPDWDRYDEYEKLGLLYVVTARIQGALIGYLSVFCYPHMHHKTQKFAFVDVLWLHPAWRKGWTGIRLIRHFERGMRKVGAGLIWFAVKDHFKNRHGKNVGDLLTFLRYEKVETVYAKVLK